MRKKRQHGGAIIEFAFMFPLLVSLVVGTMIYGTELIKELELQQVARDTASMVARGTDFTITSNQLIVARLGQELGWPVTGLPSSSGVGVVYVSTIEYLDSTCNGANPVCKNAGHWVFVASLYFGDKGFRSSNFGAPASCLPGCLDTDNPGFGNINATDTLNNTGAIVSNFTFLGTPSTGTAGFQPGQLAYLVETAATMGMWGTGEVGYAYSLF